MNNQHQIFKGIVNNPIKTSVSNLIASKIVIGNNGNN